LRRYRRGFDRIGINIYIFRRDGESYGIGFGLDVGNGERGAFSGRRGRRFVVFTTLENLKLTQVLSTQFIYNQFITIFTPLIKEQHRNKTID
jgi:hypothetical protein